MMDFLNQLLDNSQIPVFTAFILGLLTAISPCPLCTNITAVGFIGKNLSNRHKTFLMGLLYTLGRMSAYSLLGAIIIYIIRSGEDAFNIQQAVSEWGEKLLGPILIAMGLFMLLGHLLHLPKFGFSGETDQSKYKGTWGAFLLGVLFAMAFCPTSGMFYFGMLIPMSVSASGGYLLPVVFAIATSLPVLVVAWIMAFSIQNIGKFMGNMQTFQKWFNLVIAVLFIAVGIYYTITMYL